MNKILFFDTSAGSYNKGDDIIMNSTETALRDITKDSFVIKMPTHTPAFHWYQATNLNSRVRDLKDIKYKFVCGTNLLLTNMFHPWPSWNINICNCRPFSDCILVGVGCGMNSEKINFYTKKLYRLLLSRHYIHSVRDDKTREMLESMGFKAINTGCTTLWPLVSEFCRKIPVHKAEAVVFTLTDYARDEVNDQKLINILKENYKKVYFWPQGMSDFDYFSGFTNSTGIEIIPPNVHDFTQVCQMDVDYVGTRLHGGICAMQHKKRAIIICVDYRAREMNKSYNLNCIERTQIDELSEKINSDFATQVNFDTRNAQIWLSQFIND